MEFRCLKFLKDAVFLLIRELVKQFREKSVVFKKSK